MTMNGFKSQVVEFNVQEKSFKRTTLSALNRLNNDPNKLYWVHCDLNNQEELNESIQTLALPKYVVELFDRAETMAKFMDFGEQLAVRVPCIINNQLNKHHIVSFGTIVFFLTKHFCFTASFHPIHALIHFAENYPKSLKFAKTPCFIYFLILDNVINDYSDVLHEYERTAEYIDRQIFAKNSSDVYNRAMFAKKQVMKTKRYANSIRDVLMRSSGRKIASISESCRLSLQNLYNHAQTIVSEADSIREMIISTLDHIDNALMQKLNNSMYVLTAFAAIFLPLGLIAGIYGMNFKYIPELSWQYGYFYALGLMLLCGGGMFMWFKKKKWF